MSDINISETIPDKKSFFNIKRFSLKGIGQNFSIKTIDITNTRKNLIEGNSSLANRGVIFEKNKIVKSFEDISNLMNESNDLKINGFFDRKAWLDDKFSIFHATLKFNPYKHIKKLEEIEGFLHYYYSYSKNIIFIPNILKHYTPYDKDGKPFKNKQEIISLQQYIQFVDEIFEFFEQMNNKPIFVPISLKFTITEIKELLEHYIKKEHFYFWIDFESTPADLSNNIIGGKIGQINHLLRNSGQFEKCLIFATNVRREIISNVKDTKSPASDVLSTLCGANLVGVDREPQRAVPKNENEIEKNKKLTEHKTRIFNENTYYYNIIKENKPNIVMNVTSNSIKLANEFDKQKQHFLEKLEIESYLKNKEMITTYNKGKILKSLNTGGETGRSF